MADDLVKAIRKLSVKERAVVTNTIERIHERNFYGLQIKSLVGMDNFYRVRKGRIRIIFIDNGTDDPEIIKVANRDEKTYRGL